MKLHSLVHKLRFRRSGSDVGHAEQQLESATAVTWTRRIEWTLAVLMCCAGLWFLFRQVVVNHFKVVPGDFGDSRFNAIVLEHGFRFLRGDAWHHPFWSPRWAFYPHENVLAYSDNLLGTLPLYVILRVLGLGVFTALDVWVILVSVVNFVAMYLLLRAIGASRIGCALGGFLFAFGMPRGEHLNHLQLFPQFFTPLCFMCLLKLRSLRVGWVWAVFGCVVLQIYAGVYLGWFLGLALGVSALVTLAMCAFSRPFRDAVLLGFKRLWVHLVAALLVSAAALAPIAIQYGRAQAEVGTRRFEIIIGMLPRFQSYVLPADYTLLYQRLLRLKQAVPIPHEHVMFAGFAAIACMAILLFSLGRRPKDAVESWWRYAFGAIWLLTVVATFWIDRSLWRYLYHLVPGGGAIRAVTRIVLLQLLPLGVAVAWVTTWIQKRTGWIGASVFAALVVLENSGLANYNFAIADHDARVSAMKTEVARKNCSMFFANGLEKPYKVQVDAMWTSLESRIPTINGYSGNEPPHWFFKEPEKIRRSRIRAWLGRHGYRRAKFCVIQD